MVTDSPPPRTGLLTRLRSKTSSLSLPGLRAPRRRILADFHIQLDDPHRVYLANDVVKGCVCVKVERPLTLTHLVVNLIGRVDLQASLYTREGGGKKGKEWEEEFDGLSGGVTVCRDEIVLCGEGRLEPGVYKFGFELEFALVGKLPGGLPSSLDFEKGSISYRISSTLTRPTTISPTTTCTTKLSFVETIDIAHLSAPKPRVISLEPIVSKKPRNKQRPSSPIPGTGRDQSTTPSPNNSNGNLPNVEPRAPSPTPSTDPSRMIRSKTITASITLMKAGALRGDNIPVKISIHHNKPIKSLNGIILTLHRQTRFDPPSRSHPPLKKALSSAATGGTCGGTFRKDLAQTVLPLMIDPKSLTTVVRANLRVPEDVFPTIVNVPGGGVSFRYYVEVVVDLGGKLSSRDDFFKGGASILGLPRPGTGGEKDAGGANAGIAVEGGVMVETERIRREKRIVFCRFEVIIGSIDSVGGKGRRGGVSAKSLTRSQTVEEEEGSEANDTAPSTPRRPSHSHMEGSEAPDQMEDEAPEYFRHERIDGSLLLPLPPVETRPENPMDEKTHLILAEEQLLPSAPPMDPSSPACYIHPSAPSPSGDDNRQLAEGDKLGMERQRLLQAASAPPEESVESSDTTISAPSAPILEDECYEGPPRYVR
ncbi:unnamed protein product [Tuber melanosporum]|uniref:(Perigord truffle) hypothetical protein n=1 Tax=Tuber melanosporum (strain Mel28) TaxID=656061 RepID=D5GGA8_TUBMM|nr:uncharacterized protein GSTUM_00007300001 [Tuber melanosporum]CAZ83551.1 unnamed protein product [Tuber melanosporum]